MFNILNILSTYLNLKCQYSSIVKIYCNRELLKEKIYRSSEFDVAIFFSWGHFYLQNPPWEKLNFAKKNVKNSSFQYCLGKTWGEGKYLIIGDLLDRT